MRYSEIAGLPGTPEEAKNVVLDILTVYQANGKTEIPIKFVLQSLQKQNFDIDRRLLIDLIKEQPNIDRIAGNSIHIKSDQDDDEFTSVDQGDMSKEKVKQMAKKAIDIGDK